MISTEDVKLRVLSECLRPSEYDYMDLDIRRILPQNGKILLENAIFEETIALCPSDAENEITIRNCEFKKDIFVRSQMMISKSYKIYIWLSNIKKISLYNNDNDKTKFCIDNCDIESLSLSGNNSETSFFSTKIETFIIEYFKSDRISIYGTQINKYKLFNFTHYEVNFDADNLVISDYSKFITTEKQTKKNVSEIYHRFVLKSAKSINSIRKINYELSRATYPKHISIFIWPLGYFYHLPRLFSSMLVCIILYSLVYKILYHDKILDAVFNSVFVFLTVGFSKTSCDYSGLDLLMLSESFIGTIYMASILTSILNFRNEQK